MSLKIFDIANFMGRSLVTESGGRKVWRLSPCESNGGDQMTMDGETGVDASDGACFDENW